MAITGAAAILHSAQWPAAEMAMTGLGAILLAAGSGLAASGAGASPCATSKKPTGSHSPQTTNGEKRAPRLKALNKAGRLFLKPFDALPFQSFLSVLGPASEASRLYLFLNTIDDQGRLCMSLEAEWLAPGVEGFLGDTRFQQLPYESDYIRMRETLAHNGPVTISLETTAGGERKFLESRNAQSMLLAPLIVNQRFEGFLGLDNSKRIHTWSDSEIDFLSSAASSLSHVLRHHWTEIALEKYINRLGLIHRIEHAILSAQSPDEVASAALAHLRSVIPCAWSAVWRVDTMEAVTLCRLLVSNAENDIFPQGVSFALGDFFIDAWEPGTVIERSEDSQDARSNALEQRMRSNGIRRWLHAPMPANGKPMAILSLGGHNGDFGAPGHAETIAEVAASLSIALRQCELNERLRREHETRAVLMREVNHRVKNNLASLIGMLTAEKERPDFKEIPVVRKMLDELIGRVGGLATLHAMLSAAQWQPLPIGELCDQMIRATLRDASIGKQTMVHVQSTPHRVPPDRAHILALVVTELATNSRKYGLSGQPRIEVVIDRRGDDLTLTYRDYGPGFPAQMLSGGEKASGIGFELINGLVRRNLHGTVTMRNDRGAVTEIVFPASTPTPAERSGNAINCQTTTSPG